MMSRVNFDVIHDLPHAFQLPNRFLSKLLLVIAKKLPTKNNDAFTTLERDVFPSLAQKTFEMCVYMFINVPRVISSLRRQSRRPFHRN